MTSKVALTLEILERFAVPLMSSVIQTQSSGQASDDQAVASLLASLLSKTTDLSALIESKAPFDSLKLDDAKAALAAISAQILADNVCKTGKIPEGNAVKRLYDSLDSVITFSENFTPSEEAIKRLQSLDQGGLRDPLQVNIQYIATMTPVIEALAGFSYGQPIQKYFVSLSGKLKDRALQIQKRFGDSEDVSFTLLGALAKLYATCHNAETSRLLSLSPEGQAKEAQNKDASVARIWENFDKRTAMIEALAESIAGASGGGAPTAVAQAQGTGQALAAEPPPVSTPVANAPPPVEKNSSPVVPPQEASQSPKAYGASGQAAGNPLSFFSKKPAAQDKPPPQAETPPPVQPQTLPEAPPQAPAEPPPSPPVKEQKSSEEKGDDSGSQAGSQGGSSNPMSFFKKT